jgi:putative ABC transport system permease protein
VLGGVLGFVAGLGLATLILGILSAIGFAPSDTRLTVLPSSFVITLVVGVLVTMVCAVAPALRAGRVPPLAALRDVSIDRTSRSRRRLIVGAVAIVVSALGVTMGLTSSTTWLIPGVAGLFIAMVAFGPALVSPFTMALVRPLRRLRGVTGEIAARNAARSPERTALTASALAICLALLIGVSTLGTSLVASFRHTVAQQFNGDVAVTANGNGRSGGLPASVLNEVKKLPQVDTAVAFGFSALRDESPTATGKNKAIVVMTVNPDGAKRMVRINFLSGGWDGISGDRVLISKSKATSDHLALGDTIPASLLSGKKLNLRVSGVFDSNFLGDVVADRALFEQSGSPMFDAQVLAIAASGVSNEALKAAVQPITALVPIAKVQTRTEFIDAQVSQVQGILNFIYALLGMSVYIAVLGIVLTLLLSVYERRRELGLVRAIGMTRGQVRSSVRWESIVTAAIGAVLGVVLGVVLGWIVVKALVDQGLNTFAVSVPSIVVFTIAAMVFAVVAAWWPSRRAAKADILQAIATT